LHDETNPDKAEVALEYPDKLYIGTFERTVRFDAHLDKSGISLTLERIGDIDTRKSVHLHLNDGLFAEVLCELAGSVKAVATEDMQHREALAEGARRLHQALVPRRKRSSAKDS
jgi:hypothetical protein